MEGIFDRAFKGMVGDYENLLRQYYPAHKSVGFTERNLTFYFCRNLLATCDGPNSGGNKAFAWMEVPLPEEDGGSPHVDAVVFLPLKQTVVFIEAKRFSNVPAKQKEFIADISRLKEPNRREHVREEYQGTLREEYICVLADVWLETGAKKAIPRWWVGESWPTKEFEAFPPEALGCPGKSFSRIVAEQCGLRWQDANQHIKRFHEVAPQSRYPSSIANYCILMGFHRLSP